MCNIFWSYSPHSDSYLLTDLTLTSPSKLRLPTSLLTTTSPVYAACLHMCVELSIGTWPTYQGHTLLGYWLFFSQNPSAVTSFLNSLKVLDPFLIHAGILTVFVFYRFCIDKHIFREFLSSTDLLCPEGIILTKSYLQLLYFSPVFYNVLRALRGRGISTAKDIWKNHMETLHRS